LTVAKDGAGSGSVVSVPPGIDCGITCTATFSHGRLVTLTATPDSNSTFAHWNGACSGSGNCIFMIAALKNVTATYTLSTYDLTIAKEGTGNGRITSLPAGIDCGITCTTTLSHGSVVTLTAAPDTHSTFTGWSGACSGRGNCAVTMTEPRDVVATFVTYRIYLPLIIRNHSS
jgi:hypothetical protein